MVVAIQVSCFVNNSGFGFAFARFAHTPTPTHTHTLTEQLAEFNESNKQPAPQCSRKKGGEGGGAKEACSPRKKNIADFYPPPHCVVRQVGALVLVFDIATEGQKRGGHSSAYFPLRVSEENTPMSSSAAAFANSSFAYGSSHLLRFASKLSLSFSLSDSIAFTIFAYPPSLPLFTHANSNSARETKEKQTKHKGGT